MSRRLRRTLILAGVLVALLLLAIPYLRATKGTASGGGQQAPAFVTTDLSGRPVVLRAYRGRTVVLNFWASWCVPCRSEFPVLRQMAAQHPDVVLLGVVFQDLDGPARTFLQAQGATWPGIRDPKGQIANAYDVHNKPGIPVSILIDAAGRIVERHYGPLVDQAAADAFVSRAVPAGK